MSQSPDNNLSWFAEYSVACCCYLTTELPTLVQQALHIVVDASVQSALLVGVFPLQGLHDALLLFKSAFVCVYYFSVRQQKHFGLCLEFVICSRCPLLRSKIVVCSADQLPLKVYVTPKSCKCLQDIRYQMHSHKDEIELHRLLIDQVQQINKRQKEGQAVLPILKAYLVNLACDDPGGVIVPLLVLPLLQKRLLAKAEDFHKQKAARDQLQVVQL